MKTCDLCDAFADELQVLDLPLSDFGGQLAFAGLVSTVMTLDDNSRVREALAEAGEGRVLVVDGGGSTRRALLGDMLAAQAVANGWAGVLVHGAIRDSETVGALALGVKALGTCPLKSDKRDQGVRDVPVEIAGLVIRPGMWLAADEDGVVLAARALV
ncbi:MULTISPECIES: ribonuclease E activity regulator RraA [Luteimonas]|uniref:ribonuclease E activity regulator RraA n=1 Tax=Luteimonas TaxID=83614 RepID=UPI000C7B3154|nr:MULTISPECIES: ribonuclease E activity regulator RraA [Luteimonas]